MSTTMAKPGMERKWYIIDAAGKPLGRTAEKAAVLLRGKNKPTFTPHVDCGDHVIIINAAQAVLTGRKLEQKYYRHHSGYVGGLKEVQYKTLITMAPAVERAPWPAFVCTPAPARSPLTAETSTIISAWRL